MSFFHVVGEEQLRPLNSKKLMHGLRTTLLRPLNRTATKEQDPQGVPHSRAHRTEEEHVKCPWWNTMEVLLAGSDSLRSPVLNLQDQLNLQDKKKHKPTSHNLNLDAMSRETQRAKFRYQAYRNVKESLCGLNLSLNSVFFSDSICLDCVVFKLASQTTTQRFSDQA